MVEKTDAQLVVLARSGDKNAFGQLISRYQLLAKRIAVGMVANDDIAQDLVQEAMLQAYLCLPELHPRPKSGVFFSGSDGSYNGRPLAVEGWTNLS